VRANPYTLAKDIHGIGFKTADRLHRRWAFPGFADAAGAGLNHVLLEATATALRLPVELLKEEAGKLLLVDEKIVSAALERTWLRVIWLLITSRGRNSSSCRH